LHLDDFHVAYYGSLLTQGKASQMKRSPGGVAGRASQILRRSAVAAVLLAAPGLAAAQAYPSRPLRIIIPFPPGGATDISGRYIAQKLGEAFGQQALPDNRPGANGTIGLELAAKAPPDGHTLVIGQTGNLAISPGLTKVNYDPTRDFAPISLVIASPHALAVHPSLPARSLKDVISLARSKPGQLNYASTGSGSAGHLGMELLKKTTRMDIVHVPYKGATPGLMDLVAGHVALMFTSVLSTAQVQQSGKVRVLAVGSLQRSPSLPEVPTIAESGYPRFEVISWWGVLGPAAVPKDIVARLNSEIAKVMASPDARDRIAALGADIMTSTPERFAAYIKSEQAKWGQVIKDSGARVD
jgi:tripartite-type tricarboxylate transporter receptor subunit TctC